MMRWIERGLLLVGIVCLGFSAGSWLDSGLYQRMQGRRFDALLRHGSGRQHPRRAHAAGAARDGAAVGEVVGRIEIPRLRISAIVAEGIDARTLRRAVGHVPSTALPGDAGNIVLAGHRDSFFRALKDVQAGDQVRITTEDGVYDYKVESTDVVGPERTDILAASDATTLTLITCYPFNYVGPAPDRFVVHARPS
jgi:LPXTG-site transpeptidase (sortase) family protein